MQESRTTVVVALISNAAIAIAKLVAGLITGSAAMLAEAVHSIADTVDQLVLLWSFRLGARPADDEHQFGHGMERYFWAFVAAVWIFLAGAGFAVFEGVSALRHGEANVSPSVAYVVLAIAFVFEGTSLIRAVRQVRSGAKRSQSSFGQFVRELRDPAPRVVFLEDSAAVIGILIAGGGVASHQITGQTLYDGLASIAIGVLLVFVAVAVGAHAKALLLGQAARPEVSARLEEVMCEHPAVQSIPELLTMHIGPDDLLVAARVELRDALTVTDSERVTDEIAERMREAEPSVGRVYLQPADPRQHESAAIKA